MPEVCLIYKTGPIQDRKHSSSVENTTQASDCTSFIDYSANNRMQEGHSGRDIDCPCDEQDANVSSRVFSLHDE